MEWRALAWLAGIWAADAMVKVLSRVGGERERPRLGGSGAAGYEEGRRCPAAGLTISDECKHFGMAGGVGLLKTKELLGK